MTRQAIRDYAAPLSALDEVVHLRDDSILTRKTVIGTEPYFRGHYPDYPIFPGIFIIEAVNQAARWYLATHELGSHWTELRAARFLAPVRPGDVLECACQCRFKPEHCQLEVDAACQSSHGPVARVKLLYTTHVVPQEPQSFKPGCQFGTGGFTPGDIRRLLPHRYPLLLVDTVEAYEPGVRLVAKKNITWNEPCFEGLGESLPRDRQSYPQVLTLESFLQAAGLLGLTSWYQESEVIGGVMLFGALSGCRFYRDVFPGETLEHYPTLTRLLTDSAMFSGTVWSGAHCVAEVRQVVVARRTPETLVPPSAERHAYA